jgi:hypothetical protein
MQEFDVQESDKFKVELEEAVFWLYSHNLEQSQEFADQKLIELQQEVNGVKVHLKKTPRIGQADEISGIRRFPLYSGRYLLTWTTDETKRLVTLLEFIDSKYPKELRHFHMTHESDEE